MSIAGLSFIFWRILEIITLIPTLGMMAWFVDRYTDAGALTPRDILILFIVSTLGAAWAIGTLFLYARAKHSAKFVAFVDLLFVGAFIAAVYFLRDIAKSDCSHFENSNYSVNAGHYVSISGVLPKLKTNKECAMLKASFAFAIMNCILFFITFFLALLVHHHHKDDRVVVKRETHYSSSRHAHRSPRRSHHSSRRSSHYV